jgi:hypothetical protein
VDQASALVCTLGYFRQARTGNFCCHVTMDETRPFISLGRDVTLPEPSRLMRWTGRVMAFARCLWSLPVLGIVLGAIAGTLADVYLNTEPVFRLVGLFGGWYLFYQIARAR